ncbi:uncharacterized protein DSM5745_02756 [Aspergillus mulundensis]|uniref:F-box domain-containing protein n=1 Tax=Aspergillus mulundensis TaxID=1810919 RepID=A0A3D8SIV7_9EURO|nr:hypothetical protein DSM5745_02756 [Aspergillus mulundensis]RDW86114.1 hypothetical protein DSM5745_02756 [Aspergillus mulundensis]
MFEPLPTYKLRSRSGSKPAPETTANIVDTMVFKFLDLSDRYHARSRQRQHQRKRLSLTTIPTESLKQILPYLSKVDQACLALTCKPLYMVLAHVLESELFRFPRLYQLQLPAYEYELATLGLKNDQNTFGDVRCQLLHRLQDNRAKYCVKCMKLHSRGHFAEAAYHGPIYYRPYCCSEAGVVDLCPCACMTMSDRHRVVKYLKKLNRKKAGYLPGKLGKEFAPIIYDGSDFIPVSTTAGASGPANSRASASATGLPALFHSCQITNWFVDAHVKTVLYTRNKNCGGKAKQVLVAETQYKVKLDSRVLDWQPSEAFPDAHYNLLWAMKMAEKGVLLDMEVDDHMRGRHQGTRSETLTVVRNLGSCDVPADGHWVQQDRALSASFLRLMHAYSD